MTRQEHELMLTLFATQMQVSGMILELLHSRGFAEPSDIAPFTALALEQTRAQIGQFIAAYSEAARRCGVELPEGFANVV